MKHSAKGAAKLARERERQARRTAGSGDPAPAAAGTLPQEQVSSADTGTPVSETSGGRAPSGSHSSLPVNARSASASASGGGSARRRFAQLPYALVLAGIVIGLAIMRSGAQAVRGGTLVIAGALLAGSLTRLVLPEGRAGLLGSRRRLVDVALLTTFGVGLLIAGLIVKVPT